jgi:MFS family permease
MAAVGKVIVAASYAWGTVLVGRVVDRVGKGVRSAPRDALIASSTDRQDFGRAFGFHRMGDSVGAVIGPLLALAALAVLDGNIRAALWWAVVPAVLSTLLTFFVVENRPRADDGGSTSAAEGHAQADGPLDAGDVERASGGAAQRSSTPPLPRAFWRVCIVLVVIAVVNFPDALLLLRVLDLGFTTTQVVLAYVVFNLVYTLGSYPAGAWSDRMPRPAVYGVGLVAFAFAYAGLAVVGHSGWVFVLMAVYGLFPAFTDGVGKAWVSSLVPDEHRGRAQGVFQSLSNGAVFVAGLWAGLAWGAGPGGGVVPLAVSGVLGLLAGLVLVVGRHRVTGAPALA